MFWKIIIITPAERNWTKTCIASTQTLADKTSSAILNVVIWLFKQYSKSLMAEVNADAKYLSSFASIMPVVGSVYLMK